MEAEKEKVAVIGAGAAGLSAALVLKKQHFEVEIYEKESEPGGHLNRWHALFPGREEAPAVRNALINEAIAACLNVRTNSSVDELVKEENKFRLVTDRGEIRDYSAVIIAGGFQLFEASRKEEYGYGIYPRVISSADFETLFHDPANGLQVKGRSPEKVAFVHCVGSRDAKVGNHYCSRVCCITGVKQAIAVAEKYPECEVFNFYMDLRMFGSGYEELYQEAQEKYGINFIRGRVSEAAETMEGKIQIKAEDTLLGRPLKVTVDWLVLLVGMEPAKSMDALVRSAGLHKDSAGFIEARNKFLLPGTTPVEGVFYAGACGGPASVPEAVNQGRAAAFSAIQYLSEKG